MTDKDFFTGSRLMYSSIFILGFKLFMILFLTDLFYVLVDIISFDMFKSDFYHHLNLLLLSFHITKSIAQIFLIFMVVFRWLYHRYYIDCEKKKLFEQKGFLFSQEKMFDLKNIREVKIQQGIFGKLFRYGDIVLNIIVFGGYEKQLRLKKIQNPHENIDFFQNCT